MAPETPEIGRLLQDAKVALAKSKRIDYYKILGVPSTASAEDIKKAYKKMALKLRECCMPKREYLYCPKVYRLAACTNIMQYDCLASKVSQVSVVSALPMGLEGSRLTGCYNADPDKVPEVEREEAEKKFKVLTAGHNLLSDADKRRQYDAGRLQYPYIGRSCHIRMQAYSSP